MSCAAWNEANLILPAGDVKIGPYDYNVYANSQINLMKDINMLPLKTVGDASVLVADVGKAEDASQIQVNKVRVNGQASVYLPVLKQGGNANTIAVVDGVKKVGSKLLDVPKQLVTEVVFDQSIFVKTAIDNLIHEGAIGMVLTGLMILNFPRQHASHRRGLSLRAALRAGHVHRAGAGWQRLEYNDPRRPCARLLPAHRLIRWWSSKTFSGISSWANRPSSPPNAADRRWRCPFSRLHSRRPSSFFPVTFLYGVSKFLFSALALCVVLSLFASYFVAMTVVPLFCANLIKGHEGHGAEGEVEKKGWEPVSTPGSIATLTGCSTATRASSALPCCARFPPCSGITGIFLVSLLLYR